MLSLIKISNFTIIDELELELRAGFSVMTGETGAGKSILVDAVGLTLGDRADSTAVRAGSQRADISAVFALSRKHPVLAWLSERGLESDETVCLRRTISAEGGSRAFINNHPVALKDLRELGALLVDIHGQHAHQSLLAARAQRELLDASDDLSSLSDAVATAFHHWRDTKDELKSRLQNSDDRASRLELLRFQLGEIEAVGLTEGEFDALSQERDLLRHVDTLRQAIGQAAECLYESESGSAYALASRARRALEQVTAHDSSLIELVSRITTAEIELKESGIDLNRRLDSLEADPARLDAVETRLDRIQQLARRHRVREDELGDIAIRLNDQIRALDASAESLAALESNCAEAERDYRAHTSKLTKARTRAAKRLGRAVTARLRELGLPNATFEVAISPKGDGREDSTGADHVEFNVSTNPGSPPGPIDRVASGGELSRIGLALAVVATDASSLPTLIFDEVDAGIGGAVAEVVGRRLREIATRHQVLCVTHLPQVASQGRQHYRVAKLTDGKTSHTQVRELDAEQRIEELSRMLGGVEITAATRAHAEDMIRHAAEA